MLARGLIGNYCLKYEVQDQLATCYQYLGEEGLELEAFTSVAELWTSAKGSSEWPAVATWVCRLAQRTAALHARCQRHQDADHAAAAGLSFAEAHGLQQQRVSFLLLSLQLALARWDHDAADRHQAALAALIADPAAMRAATASSGGSREGDDAGAPALDAAVLHMLRLGKVAELTKGGQQPQQHARQPQEAEQAPPEADDPDGHLPPVLAQLDSLLTQVAEAQEQLTATSPPYALRGLPTLEPLLCLLFAHALRVDCTKPKLTERYLQRGLRSVTALLEAAGVAPDAHEDALALQTAQAAQAALQLQQLLLVCRAQIMISRAELRAAREEVLGCQQLQERFPGLLRPLRPGVHLLAGQYCVAVGETAAAAAHFKVANAHASNRCAAAVSAMLEAEAHLAAAAAGPAVQGQAQGQDTPQQQQQLADAVALAVAALGSFYSDAIAGGGASAPNGGGRAAPLGYFEDAVCLMASASCLAQQGQLMQANQMLSRALKTAHRRVGHTQLVCCILQELAPTFLAQGDAHSALEAIHSANGFSRSTGDLWAEAKGKRHLAAVLTQQGENDKAASAAASAARRESRIREAAAEALADSGRHGYAAGWGLQTVG
ncbi:hypothetical protein GPECTOR_71g538 [Gonium pectorale]|uniref:Anaphase-promoting complex subunit 5 n=1 Tax=Gonium pectorale TaxID=33097 RepID=A0A150G2V0_GONPE|nr:hypothetical protein GPECTOR_71g538 [Gonium pectorale]|eukprot:KXZ44177.1 hypothetical protein GPECTOR_71g538 [Gonium pectorale]